jgi:hypothetical protein
MSQLSEEEKNFVHVFLSDDNFHNIWQGVTICPEAERFQQPAVDNEFRCYTSDSL